MDDERKRLLDSIRETSDRLTELARRFDRLRWLAEKDASGHFLRMSVGKPRQQQLRKMLLYIEFVTFCLKRELGIMASGQPEQPATDTARDRMLAWFSWSHLPPHLQETSKRFADVAEWMNDELLPGPKRTVALRKLLEAMDAAVRATLKPGG